MPLDPKSASIVLLGLIASEALAQCTRERMRVAGELEHRIAFEREHFGEDEDGTSKWEERAQLWQPVSCEVSFVADTGPGFVAAPTVLLRAQKDPSTVRSLRFSVCRMGVVRIDPVNWPAELQHMYLPKQPADFADAVGIASRVVTRAMPSLLAFVDPLHD